MSKQIHLIERAILEATDNDSIVVNFLEGLTLSNLKENGDALTFAIKNKITKFFVEDNYKELYYTKGNIAALKEFKELSYLIKQILEPKINAGDIPEAFNEVVKAYDYLYKNRNLFQTAFKNGNDLVMLVYFEILHAIVYGGIDAVLCRKTEANANMSLYIGSLTRFNNIVKNGSMDAILKKDGDYFIGGTMLISGAILFLLLSLKDLTYYFYFMRISITEKLSYIKETIELSNESGNLDKNVSKKQKDIASKLTKVIEKVKVEDIEAESKARKMVKEDSTEFKQDYSNRKELIDLL